MAIPLHQALDDCRKEEGILSQILAEDTIKFQQVEQTLNRHRAICSDALLSDFQAANGSGFKAEDRLWDNHQKVNARFRTALGNLRNAPGQKAIELRKLGHEYLKFIKNSQTFYRNFVKLLNQAYGGIPSLERVAKKLNPDLPSPGSRSSGRPTSTQIEYCCHRTLIRLGDLSRYRETELAGTEKNWAPAYGYYDLALSVCPGSGVPYNQRAVIALADKTLFRAIYYVYRSLSAEDPHPQGDMNLRRALHKIQQAWNSKELVSEIRATSGAALPKGMVAWYLRLLEMFYHGKAGSEKDALQNEVLGQLQVDLEQNPAADTPLKLILTSIAAQHAAQERFETKQTSSHQNSYVLFLELNLRLFAAFLRVFTGELKSNTDSGGELSDTASLLTPVLRRTLPALRLYGLWLEKTCKIIDNPASGLSEEQKADFWSLLAEALTAMTASFPPQDLPLVQHMLEEDEDTIGFMPLYSERNGSVWYENGQFKRQWHEISTGEERRTIPEMLFRTREFMVRGLELVVANCVPIDFDQSRCEFTYQQSNHLEPETEGKSILEKTENSAEADGRDSFAMPEDTQDKAAERMVDDIVGEELSEPAQTDITVNLQIQSPPPRTPLQPSTKASGSRTASPFVTGTHTVDDIMAIAYKQPISSPSQVQAQNMEQSRSSSRPGSQLHSPAMPYSVARVPSETSVGSGQNQQSRMQYYPEDPQLPGLGVVTGSSIASGQAKLGSSAAPRSSPLPPPLSHSRVNSAESTRGIWGGGIFTPSYQPTDARRVSGSMSPAQHGSGSTEPSAANRVPSSFPENAGAFQNGADAPWNHTLRENHRALSAGSIEGHPIRKDPHSAKMSWSGVPGEGRPAPWQPT